MMHVLLNPAADWNGYLDLLLGFHWWPMVTILDIPPAFAFKLLEILVPILIGLVILHTEENNAQSNA